MISKEYIKYLNIENLQIIKHTQILDTFGGELCTTKEAVELYIKLEGTTTAVPVLFLINEMTDQRIATIGQDVIRKYAWDIDFATWENSCNIWSMHPQTPHHQFKSPVYSDNPLSLHHIYSTRQEPIKNIRYSAPYVNILTRTNGYDTAREIQYFVDTGAAESSITTAIIKEKSWTNLVDTSESHGLKGLRVTIPTLGKIALWLQLQQQDGDHVIIIKHIFQVIESEIEEASIGLPFFIENNLVHSSSLSAISTIKKIKMNGYNYPRDKGVRVVPMYKLIHETGEYVKADVAVPCKLYDGRENEDGPDSTQFNYDSNEQMKQVKLCQAGVMMNTTMQLVEDEVNPSTIRQGEAASPINESAAISLAIAAVKPPDDKFTTLTYIWQN